MRQTQASWEGSTRAAIRAFSWARRRQDGRSTRESARGGNPMGKILLVVSEMSTKIAEHQCEDTAFANF
ncbi:hypothetical protein AB205_0072300 [Aquarana catesbeiana]|uniref:Uncharacterized protein n=1 Tax=Aquarana catesbeiana TaxID=8400 RepID=A0A2G9SKF5_AQUCT|nr:hypothetical protein AB205_0072300 [Aquarana catesbeiana]